MGYYVEVADNTSTGTKITCYGKMPAHSHGKGILFSKAIREWLVDVQGWTNDDYRKASFKEEQPEPDSGEEFKWDGKKWVKK